MQEIVNGQTTAFAMDLNTGLTQVLSDGTNTYIYGNGRIAQVNAGTEYFLGDALGSVRQLTNNSGAVTYASVYDPYGVTTQTSGASQTAYGFTNEYTSQGLVYLRARYYAPGMGRFLTRDMWGGNPNVPISYNRWAYTYSNPVNLADPSGYDPWWCEEVSKTKQEKQDCINAWMDAQVQGHKPQFYLSAYTQENWDAEHSIYLNQQMGGCTACHLGKEMNWREEGFIPSNSQINAFRSNAAQIYYSGSMMTACSFHPYAMGACVGIGLISNKNPITGRDFSSNDEKVTLIGLGAFAALLHLGNSSCFEQTTKIGLLPESELPNFAGRTAKPTIYGEGTRLYRVHSPGTEYSNYWSTEPPRGVLQWRIDQSVPPQWGNTAEKVSILTVPPGGQLAGWSGQAAYQGGFYVGQAYDQVYLPRVPSQWIQTMDFKEFITSFGE